MPGGPDPATGCEDVRVAPRLASAKAPKSPEKVKEKDGCGGVVLEAMARYYTATPLAAMSASSDHAEPRPQVRYHRSCGYFPSHSRG